MDKKDKGVSDTELFGIRYNQSFKILNRKTILQSSEFKIVDTKINDIAPNYFEHQRKGYRPITLNNRNISKFEDVNYKLTLGPTSSMSAANLNRTMQDTYSWTEMVPVDPNNPTGTQRQQTRYISINQLISDPTNFAKQSKIPNDVIIQMLSNSNVRKNNVLVKNLQGMMASKPNKYKFSSTNPNNYLAHGINNNNINNNINNNNDDDDDSDYADPNVVNEQEQKYNGFYPDMDWSDLKKIDDMKNYSKDMINSGAYKQSPLYVDQVGGFIFNLNLEMEAYYQKVLNSTKFKFGQNEQKITTMVLMPYIDTDVKFIEGLPVSLFKNGTAIPYKFPEIYPDTDFDDLANEFEEKMSVLPNETKAYGKDPLALDINSEAHIYAELIPNPYYLKLRAIMMNFRITLTKHIMSELKIIIDIIKNKLTTNPPPTIFKLDSIDKKYIPFVKNIYTKVDYNINLNMFQKLPFGLSDIKNIPGVMELMINYLKNLKQNKEHQQFKTLLLKFHYDVAPGFMNIDDDENNTYNNDLLDQSFGQVSMKQVKNNLNTLKKNDLILSKQVAQTYNKVKKNEKRNIKSEIHNRQLQTELKQLHKNLKSSKHKLMEQGKLLNQLKKENKQGKTLVQNLRKQIQTKANQISKLKQNKNNNISSVRNKIKQLQKEKQNIKMRYNEVINNNNNNIIEEDDDMKREYWDDSKHEAGLAVDNLLNNINNNNNNNNNLNIEIPPLPPPRQNNNQNIFQSERGLLLGSNDINNKKLEIINLQAQINDLNRTNETLVQQIAGLMLKAGEYRNTYNELEKAYKDYKKNTMQKSKENNILLQQLNENKLTIEALQMEQKKLNEMDNVKTVEINKLTLQLQDANKSIKEKNNIIDDIQNKINEKDKLYNLNLAEFNKINNAYTELNEKNKNLNKNKDQYDKAYNELNTKYINLGIEQQNLVDDKNKADKAYQKVNLLYIESKQSFEKQTEDYKDINNKLDALKNSNKITIDKYKDDIKQNDVLMTEHINRLDFIDGSLQKINYYHLNVIELYNYMFSDSLDNVKMNTNNNIQVSKDKQQKINNRIEKLRKLTEGVKASLKRSLDVLKKQNVNKPKQHIDNLEIDTFSAIKKYFTFVKDLFNKLQVSHLNHYDDINIEYTFDEFGDDVLTESRPAKKFKSNNNNNNIPKPTPPADILRHKPPLKNIKKSK